MKTLNFLLKSTILITSILFSTNSHAQDMLIQKLAAYKTLLDKNQIEKIHIHTNQPVYMNYDTLWFKAYVINTNLNRPSLISKSLTVELLDLDGRIIRKAITKLNVGLSNGYLNLSDTLKSGNYLLRAYTPNSQKFGKEHYFVRLLTIKNIQESVPIRSKEPVSYSFYPEGGDLIQNLESVVGFKAVSKNGLGVNFTGTIKDGDGKIIRSVAAENLGMGQFKFTPMPNTEYFLETIGVNNKQVKFKLPNANANGYTMNITSTDDSLKIKLACSSTLNIRSMVILGSQDGVTRYIKKVNSNDLSYILTIPKSTFYTGIIQFTLFDMNNLPISERLVFCDHNDFLKIEAKVEENYKKKDQVKLSIDLKTIDGNLDIGSLSASVYSESAYTPNDSEEHSIFSDLLLANDLKGFIENPNSYFVQKDTKVRQRELDNLLLTQGWRRFSWKHQLYKALPSIHEVSDTADEIKGQVSLANGKPYIHGEITLFQSGDNKTIHQSRTDSLGNFAFKELTITDLENIIISTNTAKEKDNLRIKVFNIDTPTTENIRPDQFLNAQLLDTLSFEYKRLENLYLASKGINLKQVIIKGIKPELVTESANLNGPGKADVVITAKDLETAHDLSTYLLNNVNGLKTYEGRIYSREVPYKGQFIPPPPPPMLVIYDGIPLEQETFNISSIDPNDVNSIEVLKGASASIYGMNSYGGVLIISLKRGRDHSKDNLAKFSKGILSFQALGYQKQREFYLPVYSPSMNTLQDLRRSVYWNPNIVTSSDKKIEISYFNSDLPGKFKIVIEGVNADGQIGRAVYSYTVN